MRIKSTLLIAFCLLLFACPPKSNNTDETKTAVLTKTNYVYEGDLYRFALTIKINTLNKQIEVLQSLNEGDSGFEEAEKNTIAAKKKIAEIKQTLSGIKPGVAIRFPTIPPPPPPPAPCLCFDLYNSINYIVSDAQLKGFTATLTNGNQEKVFSTDQSNPLNTKGLEGEFSAYNFGSLQDDFTGNGFLTITKKISDNNVLSYSVPVTVNKLQ